MKKTHDILRERLLARAGLSEELPPPVLNLRDLERSEWDWEFECKMRARLIMGALRYGLMRKPGKPQYDRIASMIKRLEAYRRTGNTEMLVDVANLCLLEFVEGCHPLRHFGSIDDGEHVAVTKPKQ